MKALPIALGLALCATAANAQPSAEQALNAAVFRAAQASGGPRLPREQVEAHVLRSAGIARTSVERRGEAATAALGFLCGIQEGARRTGSADAFGSDPHGRFLGAKLSFAFR